MSVFDPCSMFRTLVVQSGERVYINNILHPDINDGKLTLIVQFYSYVNQKTTEKHHVSRDET